MQPGSKTTLFSLFLMLTALLGCSSAYAQTSAEAIKPGDLEGIWIGKGYTCNGQEPDEEIRITAHASYIVAVKTRGDDCVPSGHRTWQGMMSGNAISGEIFASNGPRSLPILPYPIQLTVIDKNRINSSWGVYFVRTAAEQLPKEDPGKGDLEVKFFYGNTGAPAQYETVSLYAEGSADKFPDGSTFLGSRDKGRAVFKDLKPGPYRVKVTGDGWIENSRQSKIEIVKDKTRVVRLNLVPAEVEVYGSVKALLKGGYGPIQDAPFRVIFNDGTVEDGFTDKDGKYKVRVEKELKSYRFEVDFKDKDGRFTITSQKGFSGQVVTAESPQVYIEKPLHLTSIFTRSGSKSLKQSIGQDKLEAIEAAGAYYHYTKKAADFARDTLNLKLNHALPVEAKLFDPQSKSANYNPADSTIKVDVSGSGFRDLNSPDNREYHEFGHHVMADAATGGENTYERRIDGEKNHDGVKNGRSVDSVVEGFAEFYSLWVQGSSVYDMGPSYDLEVQRQDSAIAVTNPVTGTPVYRPDGKQLYAYRMVEEFQVAALLWDILDSNQDGQDRFDLTDQQMWAVLNRITIKDVESLYKELRGPLRLQDTNKNDGLSDLDALFVEHRFFSDTNRDGVWQQGEKIGVADFYHKAGTIRTNKPIPPNHFIRLELPDNIRAATTVDLRTVYTNGEVFEQTGRPVTEGDRVYLFVPSNAEYVTITPNAPGYTMKGFNLTPDDYLNGLSAAHDDAEAGFARFTPEVTPNDVPVPTGFQAERDMNTLWFGWSGETPRYFIIQGYDAPALNPDEGILVYDGSATAFGLEDEFLGDGVERFYTLFGVSTEGELSKGVPLVWAGNTERVNDPIFDTNQGRGTSDGGGGGGLWFVILPIGMGLILLFFIFRRRNAKDQS